MTIAVQCRASRAIAGHAFGRAGVSSRMRLRACQGRCVLVVYSLSRLANPDTCLGGLNFVPREMSRALSDKSIDDVTQLDEEIAMNRIALEA